MYGVNMVYRSNFSNVKATLSIFTFNFLVSLFVSIISCNKVSMHSFNFKKLTDKSNSCYKSIIFKLENLDLDE